MADDGQAPPLYCKASPALLWGSMYGTEHLDPSGLRKWKATAVHHTSALISKLCLLIHCNLLCRLLSARFSVTSQWKSAISCLNGFLCSLYEAYFSHAFCDTSKGSEVSWLSRYFVTLQLVMHAQSCIISLHLIQTQPGFLM